MRLKKGKIMWLRALEISTNNSRLKGVEGEWLKLFVWIMFDANAFQPIGFVTINVYFFLQKHLPSSLKQTSGEEGVSFCAVVLFFLLLRTSTLWFS